MSLRGYLVIGSLVAHGVMVVALGGIRAPAESITTAIEVTETKKAEPPPPAKVEEPPPEPPQPKEAKPRAPAAKAEATPPPDAPEPPKSALAGLPDLGLELSGGTGGPGFAASAPRETAAPRASTTPVAKTLEKAAAAPKADACDEPPAKPKLLNLPQPAYTDAARAAGVEGKVRVQLTVDENGKVVDVRALTSLGHGLDEAALAAARGATFEAAVRCGKPSKSTFTIAIRFSAS